MGGDFLMRIAPSMRPLVVEGLVARESEWQEQIIIFDSTTGKQLTVQSGQYFAEFSPDGRAS